LNEDEEESDSGEQHLQMNWSGDFHNGQALLTTKNWQHSLAAGGDHVRKRVAGDERERATGPGVRWCARCNTRSRTENRGGGCGMSGRRRARSQQQQLPSD
jgi:hypothetical protein